MESAANGEPVVCGERGRLPEWSRMTTAVSSELIRVECLRVLDRARIARALTDRDLSRRRGTTINLLEGFDLVRLNRVVLERASRSPQ